MSMVDNLSFSQWTGHQRSAALTGLKAAIAATLALVMGSASADNLVAGDAEAGKTKSTVCAACHGVDGNSLNPVWPSIAGQHSKYLKDQLAYFKSGDRKNVLMTAQALGLSDQDMADLAAYFAGQDATAREVSDPSSVAVAERLYKGGDNERGIPACIACHGPTGAGNPGVPYPAVGGQHATYIASSLREYAADNDNRNNNASQKMMVSIALKLEPAEIDALASYLQGLK